MKINKSNIKKGINVLFNDGPIVLMEKIRKPNNSPVAPTELLSKCNFEIGKIDLVIENTIDEDKINLIKKEFKNQYNIFIVDNGKISDTNCQIINKYTFKSVFKARAFVYIYQYNECQFSKCFNININEDIKKSINEFINKIDGMKLLANYNQKNNVSVKTSTFFNYMGTNYYSGGAERYLLDLYDICDSLKLNLNIYQHGDIPFFRKYHNINVIGLNIANKQIDYSYNFIDKQTKNYIYHTFNNTSLHIYSAFQECYPNHIGPSIGISHGISWDNKMNNYSYGKDYFWDNKKIFLEGAIFCDRLISVDTNTANWFQTVDYDLGNRKFHVIPNYVDNKEFFPRNDYLKQEGRIVITYPRRLYEPRGLYIVLDIVEEILKKYPNVEFHFVGKGFEEDVQNIEKEIKKYPDRIKCYSKAPQDMKDVYKYTDISLIPTQYSEGTSLSCLEALSSGNLVIATRIGGLTDLVINGFNGYLIEPSAESLKDTLINVLDNFDNQKIIRKNAIESAKAFNKNIWKERWIKEIETFDIKGDSKNNDLIEFYLNDINSITNKVLNLIKEELNKGNLIYLRFKDDTDTSKISHELLQVVPIDEEVVSLAKKIYKDKNYKDKIERLEKVEII